MYKITNKTKMFDWKTLKQMTQQQIETIRKNCSVGFDLDNTLVNYDSDVNKKDHRPFKLHQYYSQAFPSEKFKDTQISLIITGRKYCYRNTTINSLLRLGIYPKYIIFFPVGLKKTNDSLCQYKAEVINLLQLETYYEDDKDIHNYLRHHCPNTNIIKVGGPPIQTLR